MPQSSSCSMNPVELERSPVQVRPWMFAAWVSIDTGSESAAGDHGESRLFQSEAQSSRPAEKVDGPWAWPALDPRTNGAPVVRVRRTEVGF